jgi:hypothetical protein
LHVNNLLDSIASFSPCTMHRLRCGVIYTNAFADYIAGLAHGPRQVLALEYLRASTGPKKGSEWWRMEWWPAHRAPEECMFKIGTVPVVLSRQSQRGLKNRCLDWRNGQVAVLS